MEEFDDLANLTDLAVEARDLAVQRTGEEISGVSVEEVETEYAQISRIGILNQVAARRMGKPVGDYITITSEHLRTTNRQIHEQLSGVLARELNSLLDYSALAQEAGEPTILVIGLGNWNATPDALGPGVVHHLLITRHLYDDSRSVDENQGVRPVCALAPGVLGLTGIETAEIIKGTVDRVKPDLVLAVDALAARESDRLASTIQLSNTGIYPGSGIGKHRIGITEKDMGVPVIALGMPTVINSVNIVKDTINQLNSNYELDINLNQQKSEKQIIKEVLKPYLGDLIVAPKGIDQIIRDAGRVIGGGINVALHPDITEEEVSLYLQ